MALENIAPNVWCVSAHHRFLGAHIDTRMTIIKLRNGDLWIHSPVQLDEDDLHQIKMLGKVQYIVCPNLYHHMYVASAIGYFPDAILVAPKKLYKKRADIAFDVELNEKINAPWKDELAPFEIKGSLLNETVFFHHESQTLISSDLVENFKSSEHFYTKLYLKLMGLENRITWAVPLRLLYWNRARARTCINKIYELPINNLIVAHGNNVLGGGLDELKKGLKWLMG